MELKELKNWSILFLKDIGSWGGDYENKNNQDYAKTSLFLKACTTKNTELFYFKQGRVKTN